MDADRELENLKQLAKAALDEAGVHRVDQAEVGASVEQGLSVAVRLGEVESLEHQRNRSLGITVYLDHRKGSASTADFSERAVRETVAKACSIARYTARDEFAGLADAELLERSPPDVELYHPWALPPEEAMELARRCEAAALALDQRIDNSEGGSVSSGASVQVYANSHGFCAGYPSSHHSLSCAVLARDEAGMERDHWYSSDRDWRRLDAPEAVGREAGQRTLMRLGARQLDTRHVPVVYPAELARGLIATFVRAISGSAQYRESSFLLKAAGSAVFPSWMSIREQPHIPGAVGSAPFDDEGVAVRERDLVAQGVLQGYVLSSYSARKLGLTTTGNAGGIHNLIVRPTAADQQELLHEMGTGLLLTELMGQGINPVTGDYSRGAAGFWVEDGRIAYPVSEITVAGNLREMFSHLRAAGGDVDTRGVIRCGSLLVDRMTVAGN